MTESKIRSEILETGNPKIKSARIVVEATPSTIFAILANPKRHRDIDGSATVTANVSGPRCISPRVKIWYEDAPRNHVLD